MKPSVDHDLDRPLLHFAADEQWINDPNGLVYLDGEYHLCCQINPAGTSWGNMSWAHSVSRDLLAWSSPEVAIEPYPARVDGAITMIFSGSALVDRVGLSGARDGEGLLAYYTAHERAGDQSLNESVALATSADRGRSWSRHPANPLLDLGRTDYRDPKVFWHAPTSAMVMLVADPHNRRIEIHRSNDGLNWAASGVFSAPSLTEMIWECPDLAEVPIEGGGTAWLLQVSAGHRCGPPFTGMQYWVGDFDGHAFTSDGTPARPVDHGPDFYAAITYNDLPAEATPVAVGWASNWAYAASTPTQPWRGVMSIPRNLGLRPSVGADGARVLSLVQRPIASLGRRVARPLPSGAPLRTASVHAHLPVDAPAGTLELDGGTTTLTLVVERQPGTISLTRRVSPEGAFHPDFAGTWEAPLPSGWAAEAIDIHVLVDGCLVEVFAADGEVIFTTLGFPTSPWALRTDLAEVTVHEAAEPGSTRASHPDP